VTLPANIRINVKANFPTQVQGSGYVTLTKVNGIWTIANDYTVLGMLLPGFDPTAWFAAVENLSTKQFAVLSVAQLIAGGENTYREITAAGDVTVGVSDIGFLMNKTVGATTNINLPLANTRNGVPVWVKDYKGDSNVNNITFVMAGADTVDGFTQAQANANGRSKLALAYGTKTFWPRAAGGWYIR
jgi:hypothetical protein